MATNQRRRKICTECNSPMVMLKHTARQFWKCLHCNHEESILPECLRKPDITKDK